MLYFIYFKPTQFSRAGLQGYWTLRSWKSYSTERGVQAGIRAAQRALPGHLTGQPEAVYGYTIIDEACGPNYSFPVGSEKFNGLILPPLPVHYTSGLFQGVQL